MSTAEAARAANKAYAERRAAEGAKRLGLWFSQEALEAMEVVVAAYGSKEGAVCGSLIREAARLTAQKAAAEAHRQSQATSAPPKPKKAASARESRGGVDVQVGPVKVQPGARLKKR